ncbi:MAG: S41 family peptidase [Trueperaceae bacterium]
MTLRRLVLLASLAIVVAWAPAPAWAATGMVRAATFADALSLRDVVHVSAAQSDTAARDDPERAAAAMASAAATMRQRVFDGVVDLFRDRYWDPGWLDWDAWADQHRDAVLSATTRPVFDALMRRMVSSVGDGHSRWLGLAEPSHTGLAAQAVDGAEAEETKAPAFGLRTRFFSGAGLVVERVLPGSPADAAGIVRGDVLERVNDADLKGANVLAAARAMDEALARGEAMLDVRRGSRTLAPRLLVALPLDQAVLELTPYATMLDANVGYLYVPSFALPGTGARMHALLTGLAEQGADAYLLDLRGNLGGSVAELGVALGAFLEGEWGQAVSREGVAWVGTVKRGPVDGALAASLVEPSGRIVRQLAVERAVTIDAPLAVLVDAQTGSAAEVAAHVLQASGRAAVIGQPTTGNVEVVQGFALPDGSSVLVAVANLLRMDGGSMDAGVMPDVDARATLTELAEGLDAAVAAGVARLLAAPFTPGRWFR